MDDDAGSEACVDTTEKMESPTVESPTRHFAEGFADRTPHSQAGPPQKGRSDVSHLNQMEGDAGSEAYVDAINGQSNHGVADAALCQGLCGQHTIFTSRPTAKGKE